MRKRCVCLPKALQPTASSPAQLLGCNLCSPTAASDLQCSNSCFPAQAVQLSPSQNSLPAYRGPELMSSVKSGDYYAGIQEE